MCLVWGLTWLPVKIGSAHVPPVFLAASRFLIAGALMLMLAGRPAFRVPKALWSRVFWTGMAVNTGNYAFLFWGIAHAPTGLAAIVNFAMIPIVTIIAGRLFGDEVIDRRKLAAIALGVVGLTLLFASRIAGPAMASRDPLELAGLAAIALGTISYCCGAVLTRPFSAQLPTMVLAGWQTLIGGVGLAAISLALEPVNASHLAALVAWPTLPALAFLIVGGSLVGFTVYLRLLRDWGAFRAGLYAFVSPAIAVAVGIIFLNEPFGASEAVGALIMFAAAALALKRPARVPV